MPFESRVVHVRRSGEDFLVFALLLAQAEDGSIADASNTLTIELLESDNPLGPGQLDIASLKVNDIPLPPAAWLFLSAIGLLAGVSSRRRAGALPDSPKFG